MGVWEWLLQAGCWRAWLLHQQGGGSEVAASEFSGKGLGPWSLERCHLTAFPCPSCRSQCGTAGSRRGRVGSLPQHSGGLGAQAASQAPLDLCLGHHPVIQHRAQPPGCPRGLVRRIEGVTSPVGAVLTWTSDHCPGGQEGISWSTPDGRAHLADKHWAQ